MARQTSQVPDTSEEPVRENPLIILWLDNLGVFYPLIAELGLTNIAAAFEGGTIVRHLISPVPSVTESAEVVVKAGCGLDQLPVLGEVTFDRATRRYFNLKQTNFDRETGTVTPVEGAPKLADFVGPALAKRLIPNLGSTTCQIGWELGQPSLHPPQWGEPPPIPPIGGEPPPSPPLGGKEGGGDLVRGRRGDTPGVHGLVWHHPLENPGPVAGHAELRGRPVPPEHLRRQHRARRGAGRADNVYEEAG